MFLLVYVNVLTQLLFETCPVIQRKIVRNYDTKTKSARWKCIRYSINCMAVWMCKPVGFFNLGDSRAFAFLQKTDVLVWAKQCSVLSFD